MSLHDEKAAALAEVLAATGEYVWTVPVAPPATTQLETLLTNWRPDERTNAF